MKSLVMGFILNYKLTLRLISFTPLVITGKKVMFGNNVSKSLNRTKRRFDVNLIKKRFFIPDENKWITLKISASALKTINKKGFSEVLIEARKQG